MYEKSVLIFDVVLVLMYLVEVCVVLMCDGCMIGVWLYLLVVLSLVELLFVFVYYYGGGFMVGSVDMYDVLCWMFVYDV